MNIEILNRWKACVMAVQDCAGVVLVHRVSDDNSDIIFPDIDGPYFNDLKEHTMRGEIETISIPEIFNMRNEIFESDLSLVKVALAKIANITVSQTADELSTLNKIVVRLDQHRRTESA
ncbi:MAG: hypothetical protein AAFP90_17675 [Planctomycetota bacterium]